MAGLPWGITRVVDRPVLSPEVAEHALQVVQQLESCGLDPVLHAHRVVRSPSQAVPAGGTRNVVVSHTLISPTVILSDRLGKPARNQAADQQTVRPASSTASQQQPDRRGEVAAFQNAGRHPQAQPLWLVCPGVLRGSRIALYYRRGLLNTPCRSFNSWNVAAGERAQRVR